MDSICESGICPADAWHNDIVQRTITIQKMVRNRKKILMCEVCEQVNVNVNGNVNGGACMCNKKMCDGCAIKCKSETCSTVRFNYMCKDCVWGCYLCDDAFCRGCMTMCAMCSKNCCEGCLLYGFCDHCIISSRCSTL